MPASSASIPARRTRGHRWLPTAVWALDARLRLRHGVSEYTRCEDCIFRMALAASRRDLTLADGTGLRAGDRVIDLHVWNEQFPRMLPAGPTLGWAKQIKRSIDLSLRELARHLASRCDLDDVRAVRACLRTDVAETFGRLARFMARYGFEAIAAAPAPPAERMHRLGENIVTAAMVLASNPAAFRTRCLWHSRIEMYLSRASLEARYGCAPPLDRLRLDVSR